MIKAIEVCKSNSRLLQRPTWDQYFRDICEVVKTRSLDNKKQVGVVIVDERNRIVATGYNSYPQGCKDNELPFDREGKQVYTSHAELNAIASCGKNLSGCTIYCPFYPCPNCFHAIIASGIKEVKYWEEYESLTNNNEIVNNLANQVGIKLTKIS